MGPELGYNLVRLHTPVKIAGRYFADIDIKTLKKDSNIDCKIAIHGPAVRVEVKSDVGAQHFLIPFNNIIYIERK